MRKGGVDMSILDPEKAAKLVLEAYQYARVNNLDVNKREDVIKILKAIDPENFSEENVEPIMIGLQATATRIKADLERKNKIN